MLRHEYLQWVILRYTLAVDGENDRPTSWPSLKNELPADISASGAEIKDALTLLYDRGLLTLNKHRGSVVSPPVLVFDYSECPDKDEFFNGEFRMRVTPEGRVHFHELEAKLPAMAPPRANKIGF